MLLFGLEFCDQVDWLQAGGAITSKEGSNLYPEKIRSILRFKVLKELNHSSTTMIVFDSLQNFTSL